ncbi:uncharacterized protein RJT20DRAFT_4168 [Scheffersomyces xylosifermentans]|uniref:uncharacterized protein n=1 Tax=Scheffersomyces xylosifermentans TaxID=1304137 RepID=UPI00315D92E0
MSAGNTDLLDSNSFTLLETNNNEQFPSFSSLITDQPYMAGRGEILGFRRIAKVCSRPLTRWGDSSFGFSSTRSTFFDYGEISQKTSNDDDVESSKLLEFDPVRAAGTPNENAHKVPGYSRKKSRGTLRRSKASQENISKSSSSKAKVEKAQTNRSQDISRYQRVVVISGIPNSAEVNGVLSQVYGGPLERLVFHENGGSHTLELYFLFPDHAKRFMAYATCTRLFIVNGVPLTVEWASKSNTEDLDSFHPLVPKPLLQDVVHHGSRRCLIFSKVIAGKKIREPNKMFYPEPTTHFSKNLNISEIKNDFSKFGAILDICPVISRKLCFSLQYADIRSAILAKMEVELDGSTINMKYGGWYVWFGRDITDRPCYCV